MRTLLNSLLVIGSVSKEKTCHTIVVLLMTNTAFVCFSESPIKSHPAAETNANPRHEHTRVPVVNHTRVAFTRFQALTLIIGKSRPRASIANEHPVY